MNKILFTFYAFIMVACFCFSCQKGKNLEEFMTSELDSILKSNPDSAYTILKQLKQTVDSIGDHALEMRYVMQLASAQNKLYMQMPSDSVFKKVVEYYHNNGSSNDRIKANYLLGCIYRDMGEAPMALHYYQEAIECADTLKDDCDYSTLLCVSSQMGDLYYFQYLPEKAIESYKQQSYYASKGGDIYNQIRGIELQIQPYWLLQDTAKVVELSHLTYKLYKQNNMPDKAARVFTLLIYHRLSQKDWQKARRLMDIFENESGLFDDKGNITDGRYARYNYARGLYALNTGNIELANDYFRILLKTGFEIDAYAGFVQIYRKIANPDSTYKYIEMAEKMLKAKIGEMQTQALMQATSMYKYERMQHEADEAKGEARDSKERLWIIIVVSLISIMFIIYLYYRRKQEINVISSKYAETYCNYQKSEKEREVLKSLHQRIQSQCGGYEQELETLHQTICQKEVESGRLKIQLHEMEKKYSKFLQNQEYETFMRSINVRDFINSMTPTQHFLVEEDTTWDILLNDIAIYLPSIDYEFNRGNLTRQERIVAMLRIMNISTDAIGYLINRSSSRISKICKSINTKIFGEDSAMKLKENLLNVLNANR